MTQLFEFDDSYLGDCLDTMIHKNSFDTIVRICEKYSVEPHIFDSHSLEAYIECGRYTIALTNEANEYFEEEDRYIPYPTQYEVYYGIFCGRTPTEPQTRNGVIAPKLHRLHGDYHFDHIYNLYLNDQ